MNSSYRYIVVFILSLAYIETWLLNNAAVSESTRIGHDGPKKNELKNYTSPSLSSLSTEEENESVFVSAPSAYGLIVQDKSTNNKPPNGITFISPEKNRGDNVDDDDSICFNQCGEFLWIKKLYFSCCTCCTNRIVIAHKMGFVLGQSWKEYFNNTVSFIPAKRETASLLTKFRGTVLNDQEEPEFANTQLSWTKHIREVLIVRNLYSALVSGYTYHKSGRECWLDPFGKPCDCSRKSIIMWNNYKQELQNSVSFRNDVNLSFVLGSEEALLQLVNESKSVCFFLNKTSERRGMAIYMDYAYRAYYQTLDAYYQSTQSSNFTKLVHFEDIFDAPYEVFRGVYDWFSGADSNEVKTRAGRIPFLVNGSGYDIYLRKELGSIHKHILNGHSANQDDTTRERLLTLAIEYDHTLYNGRFAKINQLFGYEEL